ncbi:MAG: ATP-grasp domain-containing protein [Mogibacterium sp.]|nr:ATP-grasp domain-containing protein [Mogibacterium sp.]
MGKTVRAGVIGASSESLYAIEEAKKRGIYTIAVDGSDKAPGLSHADRSAVIDLNDEAALFDYFSKEPVDFLLPVPVGRILIASGAVNDRFGLPGVRSKATQLSTDKWEFHRILEEKGLRDAEAVLIKSGEDTSKTAGLTFPLVLKPRFGSGSRAVKTYESFEELRNDTGDVISREEDFIAETLKRGIEYGADIFVVNGRQHLILLREKMLTPEPYRQCVGYYAIEYNEGTAELFDRVNALIEGTVEALTLDNCLMHADIIDDGESAFLIEVSPRPSGHYLHNYFTRYSTGFDMLGSYMDYAIASAKGEPFEPDYEYSAESMLIKYFDLPEGTVESVPDPEALNAREDVVCYNCSLKKGDKVGMVTDGRSVMGRGFYVVRADSLDGAKAICDEIEKEFIIREE